MVNYYGIVWGLAFLSFFVFYFKYLFKTFHWSFALAVGYTLLNAYGFSMWLDSKEPYSPALNLVLRLAHQETIIIILGCVFILDKMQPKLKWLSYICVANIVLTLIRMLPHLHIAGWLSGMSENPAMNGAITAITFPFLFYLADGWVLPYLALAIITILMSHSITPVLALIVGFFGPSFIASQKKLRIGAGVILCSSILFFFVYRYPNICDRTLNWEFFGRYWAGHFSALIGAGNGSFSVWGPVVQKMSNTATDNFFTRISPYLGMGQYERVHWYWMWLHSDWYQTLFELGVIGFVLWGNVVAHILYKFRKHEVLLGGSMAWLSVALFYYPLHFPVQLFLGLFLISFAIKKEVV